MDINEQHMPSFIGKPIRKCHKCKKVIEGGFGLKYCPHCKTILKYYVIKNSNGEEMRD